MIVLGQKGCLRLKWLYSDKSGCIQARWLCAGSVIVFVQSGCFRAKVVAIGTK